MVKHMPAFVLNELRLSLYFGNTAKFWLGPQDDYDLEEEIISKEKELGEISSSKIIG